MQTDPVTDDTPPASTSNEVETHETENDDGEMQEDEN